MTASSPDFQEIFTIFRPKVIHYLKNLVGEEEAEDLAQAVFLRIEKALPGFQGRSLYSRLCALSDRT